MAPTLNPTDILARVNREAERSVLRARNGVRYVRGANRAKPGVTPKEVVWRRDRAELWRYLGGPIRFGPPVIIVHSLVSRSYILDLRRGTSMVEHLLDAGLDVYMLDWGVADERDADNGFETYVDDYLPRAVAAARRESGCDEVTLAGYCLGGLIAMLYAAGHAEAPVRNLITMATPADFQEMGAFVAAVAEGRLNADDLIDETGNVSAERLYAGFYMTAPTKQVTQYATLLENLWNDEFVEGYSAMAQWSREHVPFPGAAFRQLVDDLIRRRVILDGSMRLGGRRIDFSKVRADVLVAMAECDSVVAPAAAAPLADLVGDPGRREAMWLKGGHVTFGTGRSALDHTWPRLTGWIQQHSDEYAEPRER